MGAGGFINDRLGKVDNGLLAVTLLAPRPDSRVAVLQPAVAGDGHRSLTDLVSPRVKLALLQLVIAFAIVVLWRARRLGGRCSRPNPCTSRGPSSWPRWATFSSGPGDGPTPPRCCATTCAVPSPTGWACRPRRRRARVADAAAARTGIAGDRVRAALEEPPPATEEDLVVLAQTVEAIRQEVTRAR